MDSASGEEQHLGSSEVDASLLQDLGALSLETSTAGEEIDEQERNSRAAFALRNLFDHVALFLPIRDVVTLGQTRSRFSSMSREHMVKEFREMLRPYFSDPEAFRDQMRSSGAIISGSSVLRFLNRDADWDTGDLDIYVSGTSILGGPHNWHTVGVTPTSPSSSLVDYLTENEGYSVERVIYGSRGHEYGLMNHIIAVFKMKRDDAKPGIDLIVVKEGDSVARPITHFNTTAVMNYMTADEVRIFFPKLTFDKRAIVRRKRATSEADWASKYTKRGYQLKGRKHLQDWFPEHAPCRKDICLNILRNSTDRRTMIAMFGVSESYPVAPVNFSVIEHQKEHLVRCWDEGCISKQVNDLSILRRLYHHWSIRVLRFEDWMNGSIPLTPQELSKKSVYLLEAADKVKRHHALIVWFRDCKQRLKEIGDELAAIGENEPQVIAQGLEQEKWGLLRQKTTNEKEFSVLWRDDGPEKRWFEPEFLERRVDPTSRSIPDPLSPSFDLRASIDFPRDPEWGIMDLPQPARQLVHQYQQTLARSSPNGRSLKLEVFSELTGHYLDALDDMYTTLEGIEGFIEGQIRRATQGDSSSVPEDFE